MTQVKKGSDTYVWDIETDGLLDEVTVIWCMSVNDGTTTELFSDYDDSLRSLDVGLDIISGAKQWIGHNLIAFDWQVVFKLHPWVRLADRVYDTLIMSRLIVPEPQKLPASGQLDPKDKYSHSLKAWGIRLGEHKGDYDGGWDQYSPEMGSYCIQDAVVTRSLERYHQDIINSQTVDWDNPYSPVNIESKFALNIAQQVETGFVFNSAAAESLVSVLSEEKRELEKQLYESFSPITKHVQLKTKVRTDVIPFNPGSRKQIGERLMILGWEPTKFNKTGLPEITPDTLAACDFPEAALAAKYLECAKRLGQLSNGQYGWLRLVTREGRIHGQVNTIGAVTGRVSHTRPNMSAVPRVGNYLGAECRDLFSAKPGWSLVGADLSGIELRVLAHYTWSFDDGAYADRVLNGDIHTVHQEAFGLPPGKEWRSVGKSGTYCLIYGGGDWKLGHTLKFKGTKAEISTAGKRSRNQLMKSLPALGKLTDTIKTKLNKNNNVLRGLDGRPLYCRSSHSALNTLCQSAAAVIAKVWYNLFHLQMTGLGYLYGVDYETHGFFHDEFQVGCRPEIAYIVGDVAESMATKAGEVLGLKVPINAEYKIGFTWKDTH